MICRSIRETRSLRVLADGQFYRVGGDAPVKVDVRIIAATHQNLEQRVQEGVNSAKTCPPPECYPRTAAAAAGTTGDSPSGTPFLTSCRAGTGRRNREIAASGNGKR
ncbi:sigma 54-interacting transcriptional regulator [Shigella flexneri]